MLLRVKKEADLEERALDALDDDRASNAASAPRIVTLDYRFGRGRTHAVDFDQLDELVTLPWTRVKTDAEEAEVRMLGIKAVPAAS